MRINDSPMCHACHGSLSVGIIFSFHAGVPVCPIICPVNPAEPKTTTQYASKSLSGPYFPFISFVGRKSLGDTKGHVEKFHDVPRQNLMLHRLLSTREYRYLEDRLHRKRHSPFPMQPGTRRDGIDATSQQRACVGSCPKALFPSDSSRQKRRRFAPECLTPPSSVPFRSSTRIAFVSRTSERREQ